LTVADDDDEGLTVWRIELEVIATPERAEEFYEGIRGIVPEEELESLTRFAIDLDTWMRLEREEDEDDGEELDGADEDLDEAVEGEGPNGAR
jgi:hypothetical protein